MDFSRLLKLSGQDIAIVTTTEVSIVSELPCDRTKKGSITAASKNFTKGICSDCAFDKINSFLQRPDPDVAKRNRLTGIAMILQLDGRRTMFDVLWLTDVAGFTGDLSIVLHQHAI